MSPLDDKEQSKISFIYNNLSSCSLSTVNMESIVSGFKIEGNNFRKTDTGKLFLLLSCGSVKRTTHWFGVALALRSIYIFSQDYDKLNWWPFLYFCKGVKGFIILFMHYRLFYLIKNIVIIHSENSFGNLVPMLKLMRHITNWQLQFSFKYIASWKLILKENYHSK